MMSGASRDARPTPVFDAHNDLLLELEYRREEENPFRACWLAPLRAGGVKIQICPTFVADLETGPELSLRLAMRQILALHRAVRENGSDVTLIQRRSDLHGLEATDSIGLVLAMEGVEPLGYEPALIELFCQLGVRMVSLTWNRRNSFADGAAEVGGLSRLGSELVRRLARLNVILDLAHASEATFWEALEQSEDARVAVSHAGCRALTDTPRNLADDQLRALADRDGVLGMMMLPLAIDPHRRTISRVVDHLEHAVEVMGIGHVGFGGDFIRQIRRSIPGRRTPADALLPIGLSADDGIEGLQGCEDYPRLIEALRDRGWKQDDVEAVACGNFVRLLRAALPDGAR